MSAHISDELPRMLTGESTRDAVLAAADHLRTCVDCQQELVSATVAHASLTSAQRFAPEIVARMSTGNFSEIERAGSSHADDAAQHAADPEGGTGDDAELALPDLSSVFAQVRQEAAAPRHLDRARQRPARTRYLVGAAAAVVVLGGGGAIYAATSGNTTHHIPAATAGRPVQLAAYDVGRTSATATIADSGTVSIDAASLPHLSGEGYEVWLTNDSRTNMKPVGWLGADGKAAVTVPTALLAQYQDLEISVQKMHSSDYAYSNVSVLRGSIE